VRGPLGRGHGPHARCAGPPHNHTSTEQARCGASCGPRDAGVPASLATCCRRSDPRRRPQAVGAHGASPWPGHTPRPAPPIGPPGSSARSSNIGAWVAGTVCAPCAGLCLVADPGHHQPTADQKVRRLDAATVALERGEHLVDLAGDACGTPHVLRSSVCWDVGCIQNTRERSFFQAF
jgi:hypothetical protein